MKGMLHHVQNLIVMSLKWPKRFKCYNTRATATAVPSMLESDRILTGPFVANTKNTFFIVHSPFCT